MVGIFNGIGYLADITVSEFSRIVTPFNFSDIDDGVAGRDVYGGAKQKKFWPGCGNDFGNIVNGGNLLFCDEPGDGTEVYLVKSGVDAAFDSCF